MVRIDDEKRKIFMLILLVSTVLLSGCGKTILNRLFKSEHEEYAEILTAFLMRQIKMIQRK